MQRVSADKTHPCFSLTWPVHWEFGLWLDLPYSTLTRSLTHSRYHTPLSIPRLQATFLDLQLATPPPPLSSLSLTTSANQGFRGKMMAGLKVDIAYTQPLPTFASSYGAPAKNAQTTNDSRISSTAHKTSFLVLWTIRFGGFS